MVHSASDKERLLKQFPRATVQLTPLPTYGSLGQGSPASLPVSFEGDTPQLIFFGFVRPYKGLDILLDALPLVRQTVRLLIVGEFWEDEARYRQQIEHLNLQDQVTIVNEYVPDEQLAAYVTAADAAVLPYRSATQSAVIQLAFGQGTPVITTDVGGLAEAVKDGCTGLVVPPEDPQALAAAIDRFFDEDLGSKLRNNIQTKQGQFSWNVLIKKLLRLSGEIAPA
jgi:glycosyltransferase involved in cell wall biosynthesis